MNQPTGRLALERMQNTYLIPADHPAPEILRARLDTLLAEKVPAACARRLDAILETQTHGLWFIRQLDLELTASADAVDDNALAELWAEKVATMVQQTLARGSDALDVVSFPDRAAYLAAFVDDLIRGRAWERWYYADMEGLKSLPTSTGVREALTSDPDLAGQALGYLATSSHWDGVTRALSEADAEAVFDAAFHGAHRSEPTRSVVDALRRLWLSIPAGRDLAGPGAWALRLLQRVWIEVPELQTDPGLRAGIELVVQLSERPASADSGDSAGERLRLGEGDGGSTQPALHDLPARIESMARPRFHSFGSPLGGVFLLLRSLLNLTLFTGPGEDVAALRLIVLSKCLGADRVQQSISDPGVRVAAGAGGQLTSDLNELLKRAAMRTDDIQEALLGAFTRLGRATGRCLAVDRAGNGSDDDVLVLRDMAHGAWLTATPTVGLSGALLAVAEGLGRKPEVVIFDSGLKSVVREQAFAPLQLWLDRDLDLANIGLDCRDEVGRFLDRSRPVGPELDHFDLRNLVDRESAAADLALSVAAEGIIRELAFRLGGFEWSGAGHLLRNFLDVPASVDASESEIIALLDPPPLQIVLRLAGLDAESLSIPWLDAIVRVNVD